MAWRKSSAGMLLCVCQCSVILTRIRAQNGQTIGLEKVLCYYDQNVPLLWWHHDNTAALFFEVPDSSMIWMWLSCAIHISWYLNSTEVLQKITWYYHHCGIYHSVSCFFSWYMLCKHQGTFFYKYYVLLCVVCTVFTQYTISVCLYFLLWLYKKNSVVLPFDIITEPWYVIISKH